MSLTVHRIVTIESFPFLRSGAVADNIMSSQATSPQSQCGQANAGHDTNGQRKHL